MIGAVASLLATVSTVAARDQGAHAGMTDHPSLDCAIVLTARTPITSADGRTFYINLQSIAHNGAYIAITGLPTFMFKAGVPPLRGDPIIGAIFDSHGNARSIPAPLPGLRVWQPRIASAGQAGWHVIFAEVHNVSRDSVTVDSASIWYGRYDDSGWHSVERIAVVSSAKIGAAFSPDIALDGHDILFAFAFDRRRVTHSNARGNQGVVMVHGGPGRWRFDTLQTKLGPNYVRLAAGIRPGSLHVGIIQPFFDEHLRPRASSLFITTYDSVWHEPKLIAGDGDRGLLEAVLIPQSNGLVASWWSSQGGGLPVQVEWTRVPKNDTGVAKERTNTVVPGSEVFDAAALSDSAVLWIARDGTSRNTFHGTIVKGDVLTDLGSVDVPADLYHPRMIVMSPDDILFIASVLSKSAADIPAATYVNHLTTKCPQGRPK